MVPACVWGSFLGRRSCVFFLSSCSARGRLLLSLLLGFASVPLPAAPAVFRGVSCRRLPLGGYSPYGSSYLFCSGCRAMSVGFAVSWVRRLVFNLVPCSSSGACGFPQHVLPQVTLRGLRNLSGSGCLSCSCGGTMYVGFTASLVRRLVFNLVPCSSSGACGFAQLPCRRLPFGVSAFSDTVCLTYCSAGGVGWAATLPLCYQCFSCTGWLAGVRWVLHPVSGSSHRGCDCSLGGSVVVPFGSTCL